MYNELEENDSICSIDISGIAFEGDEISSFNNLADKAECQILFTINTQYDFIVLFYSCSFLHDRGLILWLLIDL